MNQAPVKHQQVPVYYDQVYLSDLFNASGHTQVTLAAETGHSPTTISAALNGESKKLEILFVINQKLRGDWARLFSVETKPQIHRAAHDKSGGAVAGRSTGGVGRSKHR